MIDLRGQQVVEHVHGGGKEDAQIRLAGAPANDFGKNVLPDTRIADQDQVGAVFQKLRSSKRSRTRFLICARLCDA